MSNKKMRIQFSLDLDERLSSLNEDELKDYVRQRLDSALGFRADVERIKVVPRESGAPSKKG